MTDDSASTKIRAHSDVPLWALVNRSTKMEKLAYRIPEAVQVASVSKTKLYEAMNSGTLPAHKHGSRTVIMADDLRAWLQALPNYKPEEKMLSHE